MKNIVRLTESELVSMIRQHLTEIRGGDDEELKSAMEASLEAQRNFKRLLQDTPPSVAEDIKERYYDKMKSERLLYPGFRRNFGMTY